MFASFCFFHNFGITGSKHPPLDYAPNFQVKKLPVNFFKQKKRNCLYEAAINLSMTDDQADDDDQEDERDLPKSYWNLRRGNEQDLLVASEPLLYHKGGPN